MKALRQFFKNIYLFIYYLTPKGREAKYWLEAGKSLEVGLFEKGVKELSVKKQCIQYVKKINKRKRLSKFHLATVTNKKHKKELNEVGVIIDSKNLQFKNA